MCLVSIDLVDREAEVADLGSECGLRWLVVDGAWRWLEVVGGNARAESQTLAVKPRASVLHDLRSTFAACR